MGHNRRGLIVMVLFILLVSVVFIAVVMIGNNTPGKTLADPEAYFGIENANQMAVIVDNEIVGAQGCIINGTAYVSYETVQKYLNSRFYFDSNENLLLYTLPGATARAEAGSGRYTDGGAGGTLNHDVFVSDGGTIYIALDYVQLYTNIDFTTYESPSRTVITKTWGTIQTASVTRDTQVRTEMSVKSAILEQVTAGESLRLVADNGKWAEVRTEDGYLGYIQKSRLSDAADTEISRAFDEPVYTSLTRDHTINMAWHQVTSQTANNSLSDLISGASGLNTVAPTWFFILDTNGNIASLASPSYVATARQAGIEVWADVNDFDGQSLYGGINSNDATYELLSYTSKRQNLEGQLISAALSAGVSGINIDFEKISSECGPHYIQFIREMSALCRTNGLVLSVDSYVPSSWTTQYNRAEQGAVADYVVIMAYDENGDWSDAIGSNSSLTYVSEAIADTIKEVPAGKMILGIPFFTKLWKETSASGSSQGGISCSSMGMEEAEATLSAHSATITWDDKTGQNFGTYTENGTIYSVWLEDEKSIAEKLNLMKQNGLAGSAAWKLGQEKSSIWAVIAGYMN